jgi:hypothetical protein
VAAAQAGLNAARQPSTPQAIAQQEAAVRSAQAVLDAARHP